MAVRVIDASALAALLFGEPDAEAVAEELVDARLVAPGLISFELANTCLTKMRRNPEHREALVAAFRLRQSMALSEAAVDYAGTLRIAEDTGLTAYDASYLWLARELDVALVTLDRRLARVAGPRARPKC